MMIPILFETADLMIVVKPAGVLSASAPGEDLPSLVAAARGIDTLYPVHRLDRGVGGVCVLARTQKAAAKLTAAMGNGDFEKTYLAVTCGIPQEKTGTLSDLLYHDKRINKTFVVARERQGVKRAVLSYQTLAQTDTHALVAVQLLTGRTHQIRVQFANRGLPLVGDRKYGGIAAPAIGLFAKSLSLTIDGVRKTFTADPPQGMPFSLFSDKKAEC